MDQLMKDNPAPGAKLTSARQSVESEEDRSEDQVGRADRRKAMKKAGTAPRKLGKS
jgi:hypothetical protein